MELMRIGLRRTVLAALIVAVGSVPVVMDRCAAVCAAARAVVAATSAPACHHAESPGMRLERMPSPCGQDHDFAISIGVSWTGRPGSNWEPPMALPSSSLDASASRSDSVAITPDRRVGMALRASPLPLRI